MSLMASGGAGSEHKWKRRKNPTAGHRHRDCLGSYFSREICAGHEKGGGSSQPLPRSALAAGMAGPVVDTTSVVTAPSHVDFLCLAATVWMEVQLYLGPGDIPLLLCPVPSQGVQGHPLNLTSPRREQPGVFLLSQVQTEQLLEGTPASGCRSRQVLAG